MGGWRRGVEDKHIVRREDGGMDGEKEKGGGCVCV